MNHIVISPEQILKTAGKDRFRQGTEDFKQVAVENFQFDSRQASASINGCKVHIRYQSANNLEGACDCPDSDGFDFCRHCVCLVLHANKMAQQLLSLSRGPDKSRILAYLLSLDKHSLARQCLELIEQDNEQIERFLLKASLTSETVDFASLKCQLTQLTRNPDRLFSQRQVKHFFGKTDRFLEELLLSDYQNKPAQMIKLVEYGFQRINLLLNKVDDASGQRGDCVEKLQTLYRSLFVSLIARPETKAKRFFKLWISDQFQLLGPDIGWYLQNPAHLHLTDKLTDLANAAWLQSEAELQAWQREKLARYLMEQAMSANDTLREQQFRGFLKNA